MGKPESREEVDERTEVDILKLLFIFFVGNDILVSDEQSNGSHEYGLLHEGGRA